MSQGCKVGWYSASVPGHLTNETTKNVLLCIYLAKSKYWDLMCRRLKSLDLLIKTNVISILRNKIRYITFISYNSQHERLTRWLFSWQTHIASCFTDQFSKLSSEILLESWWVLSHVLGTTQLIQLAYIYKRRSGCVFKLLAWNVAGCWEYQAYVSQPESILCK